MGWQELARLAIASAAVFVARPASACGDLTAACVDCIDPALMAAAPPSLQYHRVGVPDEHNGFHDLRRATELMIGEGARPGQAPWEFPPDADDVRWVEQNQAALHSIDAAVWAPAFQLPLYDQDQPWSPYRQAMRLKVARARVRAAAGQWQDAARDLIEAYTIGQRMKRGDPVLISYLVANAIQGTALRGMRELAAQPSTPDSFRKRLAEALTAAPPGCEDFARTLQVEMVTFVLPGYLRAYSGDTSHLIASILEDSGCKPKAQCRTALSQLIAGHPSPFDAADHLQAAGRLIAALVEQCEDPGLRPADAADEAWLDRAVGPLEPPARDILTTITRGGRLHASSRDLARATDQLAALPNPIGRFLLRQSHLAYFPTEIQASYAATLDTLAH